MQGLGISFLKHKASLLGSSFSPAIVINTLKKPGGSGPVLAHQLRVQPSGESKQKHKACIHITHPSAGRESQ